jgi:hypothetical protein
MNIRKKSRHREEPIADELGANGCGKTPENIPARPFPIRGGGMGSLIST